MCDDCVAVFCEDFPCRKDEQKKCFIKQRRRSVAKAKETLRILKERKVVDKNG